jgi:hypothetical protein
MATFATILSSPPEEDLEINRIFTHLMWTWATQLQLAKVERGYQLGNMSLDLKFHLEYDYSQNYKRWIAHVLSTWDDMLRFQQIVANLLDLALEPEPGDSTSAPKI